MEKSIEVKKVEKRDGTIVITSTDEQDFVFGGDLSKKAEKVTVGSNVIVTFATEVSEGAIEATDIAKPVDTSKSVKNVDDKNV